MNTFVDFEKTDISNVVLNPDYFRSFEENEDHLLLDMDSYVQRKDDDLLVNRVSDVSEKKCALGEDADDADGSGWSSKPIVHWNQDETITWLMTAASCLGQPYGAIQQSLALPGKELAALSRQDFLARDPVYGERLYQLLHTQVLAGCKASGAEYQQPPRRDEPDGFPAVLRSENAAETFQSLYLEDEHQNVGSNNNSDAESDNSVEISTKRPPGRPRLLKTKKNPTNQGKLWEFIRDLLRNRKTCPSLICWEDYSQAKFRFVRSDEVAKLWGSRKGNTKMTYEKLSRAMRYYYKRKIFLPVLGRRLVYQFGPNATGWQTDNPNFRF